MSGTRTARDPDLLERGLSACMATAVLVDGRWVPNFRAASRAMGGKPSHPTLRRWWDERDQADDVRRAQAVARARGKLGEDAALDVLQRLPYRVAAMLDWLTDPKRLEAVVLEGLKGPVVVSHPPKVDELARAMTLTVDIAPRLERLVRGDGRAGDQDAWLMVEDRAKRAGLLRRAVDAAQAKQGQAPEADDLDDTSQGGAA